MAHSVRRGLRPVVRGTHRLAVVSPEEPKPMDVDIARLFKIGIAIWGVALVVSLLVPALHEADRHWWPWACVAGLVLGGVFLLYLRRGLGNAAMARPPRDPRPDDH